MACTIDLTGRVALVTGAAQGIGASIAETLAAGGARTVVNYRNSAEKAASVVRRINDSGGAAVAIKADVTNIEDVQRMRDEVVERWGSVDILVNNALHQQAWLPFAEQSWSVFQSQLDGSLKSLCNTGWVFLPAMRAKKWGRIININTVCFIENGPGQSAYTSGKGAMYSWSRTVANEVAADNVTINMIAPGWMHVEGTPESEHAVRYAQSVPMRRQGGTREIGKAALFFASDLAGFVTGSLLPVCGGLHTW